MTVRASLLLATVLLVPAGILLEPDLPGPHSISPGPAITDASSGCGSLPAGAPSAGAGPVTPPDTFVVGAVGDVMLGSWIVDVLRARGPEYPFADLRPLLAEADLLVGNLEAPFLADTTGVPRADKTWTFAVPPTAAAALTAAGFDAVGLANNYIFDYGFLGLYEIWEVFDAAGIVYAGMGWNRGEAHRPVIVERAGRRIALLAYSHTFPADFWAGENRPGTAHADSLRLLHDVGRAAAAADLVLVSFHWGAELSEWPKQYQHVFARLAIDAGADLVIGHHPHTLQPFEWYRGRLIAYSLGNFVFGSYTTTARGALLLVHFSGEVPVRADLHPLDVNNLRREFRPRPAPRALWDRLGSAVISAAADSAAAGYPGVQVCRESFLRFFPPP